MYPFCDDHFEVHIFFQMAGSHPGHAAETFVGTFRGRKPSKCRINYGTFRIYYSVNKMSKSRAVLDELRMNIGKLHCKLCCFSVNCLFSARRTFELYAQQLCTISPLVQTTKAHWKLLVWPTWIQSYCMLKVFRMLHSLPIFIFGSTEIYPWSWIPKLRVLFLYGCGILMLFTTFQWPKHGFFWSHPQVLRFEPRRSCSSEWWTWKMRRSSAAGRLQRDSPYFGTKVPP